MTEKRYDIAIIGAGPGGYVAAIKAAQLGKFVALIEKDHLGGTCLNVGCIPTKTLISSGNLLHQIKRAQEFGIQVKETSINYAMMTKRKDDVISTMRKGIDTLIKANKIDLYQGHAEFESPNTLKVLSPANTYIHAEKIILATGSIPFDVKAFPCDHVRILDSTSLLNLQEIPKQLAIIGGGYIGCEFACLFHELGSQVTIIEALPSILSTQGPLISEFMTSTLTKRGISIQTSTKVNGIKASKKDVEISLSSGSIKADYALVAVGRKPFSEGLKLEKAGLKTDEKGFIPVNRFMETPVKGIFAIGDLTGKAMLAHVASHQGIVAAINAAGGEEEAHYEAVPAVIFTTPEVATVGLSEEEAKAKGFKTTVGRIPFSAIGKAQAASETEGFAQIIGDRKTGQILGAIVIGHEASNLIAEMALAIENEIPLECVLQTIHAHPTMAESWHEAAAVALNMPIHLPPRKK